MRNSQILVAEGGSDERTEDGAMPEAWPESEASLRLVSTHRASWHSIALLGGLVGNKGICNIGVIQ